ncbi:anaerobic carbon-monoxide dehydrogenase catalytic subunit [Acetivibrio mesophilus]|jgi:carbon-monoxide dehydrogenase catalytic subunit|uniref:Carbon monoxide dehydrogenase n=1 Tax=Acetivibrio mesophilus TaxID=2487273 RepID=A0A4V1K209_9FIRM|nr:anaerobic carbon-monoxide dehydrogenase catalytic subunit [Acetivibrio mesophilus]ODM27707.1 carbon-monoxide dehydrogenase catalytic subunit [Clostridium sp. Bc-iso-3]RXE58649.1 anaerobic carbon-monoxide dehydrogenase catalytic subunit [Acetivibrio mesophilus]
MIFYRDIRYHHRHINDGDGHHHHQNSFFDDYNNAVNEYKKSFPSKANVIENTPDPAVREMLVHMEKQGCETCFDRFDSQKPHCNFGIAGVCCKNCNMGPCRVTKKSPRGVCGADADLIVARNLLRWVAAGVAAHGARGREVMLALKASGEGVLNIPISGEAKLRKSAAQLGISTEGKTKEELAIEVAGILLEDLARTVPGEHKTLKAFATKERIKKWQELDILPIGAYHEVFEALHRTSTGTDGDWENIMKQLLRCGLAFAWSSVLGSSIAMDSLFGIPARSTVKANLGALKEGYVNIAVHGHSPLLVSEIVKQGRNPEFIQLAKEKGAHGIQFYGICCSGLSAMYRYGGVIPLSNAIGAELVLGTGAIDLWVADVQDVFPSIMDVAKCFKTTVVTTSDSARLPGAEHYGYDHHHSNLDETEALAKTILKRAIESFEERRDVPVFIPNYEVDAEIGFSVEYATSRFGSMEVIAKALEEGKIRGVVNLVGCNNPRVMYEKAIADVAQKLIENNILVLTNGCASFPLLKLGYCNAKALEKAGEGIREFLGSDLPPVWHMGECLDNARASAFFRALADSLGRDIKDLPFAFASPEWSNEKGVGAALGFRLLGINSYHSVYPPVQGSGNVMKYLFEDTQKTLGAVMVVEVDPLKLADRIILDINEKRKALMW